MGYGISNKAPNGYYTASEVAKQVGRSSSSIKRLRAQGIFVPKKTKNFGATKVYLYSDKDVEKLRQILTALRPGPKPKQQPIDNKIESQEGLPL